MRTNDFGCSYSCEVGNELHFTKKETKDVTAAIPNTTKEERCKVLREASS